jgi:hypothetical protein
VFLVLRRRQITKIGGGGGGWVFDVFEFLWVYAAAAADQNRSAAARCGFLAWLFGRRRRRAIKVITAAAAEGLGFFRQLG